MLKIELRNTEERESVSTHEKFISGTGHKTYTDERLCKQDYNDNIDS